MKKLSVIIALLIMSGCLYNVSYADNNYNSSSKSSSMIPKEEDTEFTYYSNIVGYKYKDLWGFYLKDNQSVGLPPVYSEIAGLNSDYIKVKKNGKWGLIDTNCKQVIQPFYDDIVSYSADSFIVTKDGYNGIIDKQEKIIVPVYYQSVSPFDNNYIKVSKNNRFGLVSVNDGTEVVPANYDDIVVMKNYFKVKSGNKWGVIDNNKKTIVSAGYDDIKILNKKYFGVKNNKKWGAVEIKTGKEVVAPSYEKIAIGESGNLRGRKNGKWENASSKVDKPKSDEIKSITPSSKVFINQDRYIKVYY